MTFVRQVCIPLIILLGSVPTLFAQTPDGVIPLFTPTVATSSSDDFSCHIEWVGVGRALKGDTTSFGQPVDAWNAELKHAPSHLASIRPVVVVSTSNGDPNQNEPRIFRVRCTIRNPFLPDSLPLYDRTLSTRSLYPSTAPGEPNGDPGTPNVDTLTFDPWSVWTISFRHFGRLTISVTVEPIDVAPSPMDSVDIPISIILANYLPLLEAFTHTYSLLPTASGPVVLPDKRLWISSGATLVDGERETRNPQDERDTLYKLDIVQPVLRLDRWDDERNRPHSSAVGAPTGDTLTSVPIVLDSSSWNEHRLMISYHRGERVEGEVGLDAGSRGRGWSDSVRRGPESAVYSTTRTGFVQRPDMLVVEFAEPEETDTIVNPTDWSQEGFLDTYGLDGPAATSIWSDGSAPRWAIFGGGGGLDTGGVVVVDYLDTGNDHRFRRVMIPISERYRSRSVSARQFRFRIRLDALDHSSVIGGPPDDRDPIYIDDITIWTDSHPEIDINEIDIDWPYTEAPIAQMSSIPMSVEFFHYGYSSTTDFSLDLKGEIVDVAGGLATPCYAQRIYVNQRPGEEAYGSMKEKRVDFPPLDLSACLAGIDDSVSGEVTLNLTAQIPYGYDYVGDNNLVTRTIRFRYGPSFAYDHIDDSAGAINDVESFAKIPGKGLNLPPTLDDRALFEPFGPEHPDATGSLAVVFELVAPDTLEGYAAWYGSANGSDDEVEFVLYRQPPDAPEGTGPIDRPGDPLHGVMEETRLTARRGVGLRARPKANDSPDDLFDRLLIHPLPRPIALEPGAYYLVIRQREEIGVEIGGSAHRMGAQMTLVDSAGRGRDNVMAPFYDAYRYPRFWLERRIGSEVWHALLPLSGLPLFNHADHSGTTNGAPTYQNGSWVPLLRPWFGSLDGLISSDADPDVRDSDTPMRIMPNPATDHVRFLITGGSGSIRSIEICDPLGRVVHSASVDGSRGVPYEWDCRDGSGVALPSGVYLCRERSGESITVHALTIHR